MEAFSAWSKATGSPPTTLRTRRDHLHHLGRGVGCGPWDLDGPRLLEWFSGQSWAVETRRSKRTTFRAFYRWALEAGHVTSSPALLLPRVRPSKPNPMPTPDGVYQLALAAATERERLMMRLAAELGMRRAEVAVAHARDLVPDLVGFSMVVHGKGGVERVVPVPDGLAAVIRARGPGYLFPGNDHGHLSPWWVGRLVGRLMPGVWTMHKLRHRAGTRWHRESGGDLAVVQELLGHASVATTRAYVAVDTARLRAVVNAAA